VIKLKYDRIIKAWRFEWGSVYLWSAVRESQFGRREYVYLTVYVRAKHAGGWKQKTLYLGTADALAKLFAGQRDGAV